MQKLIFTFLISCSSLLFLQSQNSGFQTQMNEAHGLIENGKTEEAKQIIEHLTSDTTNLSKTQQFDLDILSYLFHRGRRKFKRAVPFIEKAYAFHKENLEDTQREKISLLYLAESYVLTGKPGLEEEFFPVGEKMFETMPFDSLLLAEWHFVKGFYYFKNSEPDKCLDYFRAGLDISLHLKAPPVWAMGQTLRYSGVVTWHAGDFEKAVDYYQQELALYRNQYGPDHVEIANTQYNLGSVYYEMLSYEKALNCYLQCEKVWVGFRSPKSRYMRYLNEAIGDMYWELGRPDSALVFYERSIDDTDLISNDNSATIALLADSLLQVGDYSNAMKYYEEALAFRKATYGEKHAMTGACQNFVARALDSKGELEMALQAYQSAIIMLVSEMEDTSLFANPEIEMNIISDYPLLESLTAKGKLLLQRAEISGNREDLQLAFETFESGLWVLEKLRTGSKTEENHLFWSQKAIPLLEVAIHTSIKLFEQTNDVFYLEKAFEISEKAKSMLLLSSLRELDARPLFNVSEGILQREHQLQTQIREYEGKVAMEESRCADLRPKILELWQKKLLTLKNQYDRLLSEIEKDYPAYFALKFNTSVVNVSQVRHNLIKDKNSALVAFFEGEEYLFTFFITEDDFQVFQQRIDDSYSKTLERFIQNLIQIPAWLENPQQAFEAYKTDAYALYQLLLENCLNSKIDRLIVVPDGNLSYLPFSCLLSEFVESDERTYRSLPYLMQKYALTYGQSASLLIQAEQQVSVIRNSKYLGFAPNYDSQQVLNNPVRPLLHNENEVTNVQEIFNGNIFVNKAATKENFLSSSTQNGILHLAGHAILDDEEPLLSGLVFTSKNNMDASILHAYELYNLRINNQLTILSACNTGKGKLKRGEGVFSLERAFQYAGSPALLSTFWTIDDAASEEIIAIFSKNLKQGMSKDVALQQAQLEYLQKAPQMNLPPFFWGAFKMTGNRNAIQWNKDWTMTLVAAALLALLGWFAFTVLRKK